MKFLFDAIFIYLFVSFQHTGKKKRKSGPWKGEDLTWVKQTDTHICPGLPIMGCLRRWWLSSMAPSYYERGEDIYGNQILVWTFEICQIYNSQKMVLSFDLISLVEFLWLLPAPDKNCTSSPTMKTNHKFCNFLCITKHTIGKFSCLCYILMDSWPWVVQKSIQIFDGLVSSEDFPCRFCYLPQLFVEIIWDYLRIITDLQCLASKPWKWQMWR